MFKLPLIACFLLVMQILENSHSHSDPLLIGTWAIDENQNAAFEISADSIYYVEEFKSYKYGATKDSIFINLDDYYFNVKYTVSKDSLFWSRNNKVTKFVRKK